MELGIEVGYLVVEVGIGEGYLVMNHGIKVGCRICVEDLG